MVQESIAKLIWPTGSWGAQAQKWRSSFTPAERDHCSDEVFSVTCVLTFL